MSAAQVVDKNARMQSLSDGVVRLGPETLHIDITNTCNTDCVTCWDHSPHLAHARPLQWKRQRAELATVRTLLDDVQSLGGLRAVILSGMGEPFTHPDIYALISDVKRRGLHLTIITNLVAADAQRIIDLGVDALLIGVQGASLTSYLQFHPSFNVAHWDRLHEMLALFRDAGRHDKHVQVICAHNAHELTAMIELAHASSASQVNFKLASLKDGTEAVRISDVQREQLLEEWIADARDRAAQLGVSHNLDVLEEQVRVGGEATAPIADIGCFLGFHYSRVTVDGTVLYCCNTEVEVGQLGDGVRFSDLWRGPSWDALRARLRAGDYFDGCHQCGKLNQNIKLSARFRAQFGDARWREVTGRGDDVKPHARAVRRLRVLP
jgi:wyosine [tRNA(Phe)-imidazoG37] synthetase (radical SAM superfamily)